MDDAAGALTALLRSFTYDAPRAELCCEIGRHFLERSQYRIAAFWYETAAACVPDETNGGFCLPDCYGYIPYLQLCVCYDRLGEREKAVACNEKAGALKPGDRSVAHNREYFARALHK